jgi:hypothetical protein
MSATTALTPLAVGAYCCLVNPGEAPIEAGFDRSFRTTHWSVVLAAGDESSDQKLEALTQLCRTYWLPVYAFVRKRGHSPGSVQVSNYLTAAGVFRQSPDHVRL